MKKRTKKAYYKTGRFTTSTLIVIEERGDDVEVIWAGEWDYSFVVKRSEITISDLTPNSTCDTIHV